MAGPSNVKSRSGIVKCNGYYPSVQCTALWMFYAEDYEGIP
jgi:hypothetical protein